MARIASWLTKRPVASPFDGVSTARSDGYALEELFVADAPTPKQGKHDPTGLLVLYGKGVRRGFEIQGTSNLDIAPTLLTLLGVPVPAVMKGRVLHEAWSDASAHQRAAE